MILSFGDCVTGDLFVGRQTTATRRIPADVVRAVCRKLDMIDAASTLSDLKAPPGNRLEALVGDLKGFHSIRFTRQLRLVFKWKAGDASAVRLMDYHR